MCLKNSLFGLNKKITFYAVFKKVDAEAISKGILPVDKAACYSITSSWKDAADYLIYAHVAVKASHFSAWAELHNLDPNNDLVIRQYYDEVLDNKDQFRILTITYTIDKLAAILRIFNHCIPLGNSFNLPVEYTVNKEETNDA